MLDLQIFLHWKNNMVLFMNIVRERLQAWVSMLPNNEQAHQPLMNLLYGSL